MTELFLKIVNMSISAVWLIAAVLALRLLLKNAPRWVPVLLWGIVAIRLLCPVTLESVFSLVPSGQTIRPEIMLAQQPQIYTGFSRLDQAVNPVIAQTFAPDPSASANPLQIWLPVAAWIWLAGVAALLLYTALSYSRLRRAVAGAARIRENLYQSKRVPMPFVLGLIRPKIYLPHGISEAGIPYVVAHEQTHIRRRDHWWKLLGFALLALHWFNPMVWLAYGLLCRDLELACDESVIRKLDSRQRAEYAGALLACSAGRRVLAACPIAFGEVGVKARIRSVLYYKKPTLWVILAALLVCAAVSVCFLTDPREPAAAPDAAAPLQTLPEPTQPAATAAPEETAVGGLAWFLEQATPGKTYEAMDRQEQNRILQEYGSLLDGFTLLARQSSDGKIAYIVGCCSADQENPLAQLQTSGFFSDTLEGQALYREEDVEAVEAALAAGKLPEEGYFLQNSRIDYTPTSRYILIQPKDMPVSMNRAFSLYLTPNGRAYAADALSRGIALITPEEPYLSVSLVSERWGEITEIIPLTQAQAEAMLTEPLMKLDAGHGFAATLAVITQPSAPAGEAHVFTENAGVPQSVLELAVEVCGYRFASPRDIRGDIVAARLECSWLDAPIYAARADLTRLQEILTNAEFGYVGGCGYGAKLTLFMEDGSSMVVFKGTDSCDSMVFGSFGGYFIGDAETLEFWQIFGLDADTKQPLA